MTKKKVCFIVSSPITVRAFLVNHINVLAETYSIYLIANFEKESLSSFNHLPINEVFHVPISREIHLLKDISSLFQIKKICKKQKFDVVHSVTPKAGLLAMTSSRLAGIRFRIHIFTGQVWHTKKGFFKYLLKIMDRLIVWNATNILVDGKSQREFLITNKIISKNNSQVLGSGSINGVDINRFSPNAAFKKTIRAQLGYNDNNVIYIFLGRFNKDKGLLDLAHAFKKLLAASPNVKLLLVGFDESNMKAQILNILNDDKNVKFIGPTIQPENYLRAADVYCLPSYREGFGTSVIEASSSGLPVICSDTYGLLGTLIENQSGLFHKVGDIQSLYTAMLQLYSSKERREKMGAKGVDFVKNNFTSDAITMAWFSFYKNTVG